MRGTLPKDPRTRQRANKASTRAVLQELPGVKRRVPLLPKIQEWHAMTRRWWRAVWRSPMASEYLDADVEALIRLAVIVDGFWRKPKLATFEAINRAQAMFGLTPLDRRRLEWIVERAEDAASRKCRPAPSPIEPGEDPRRLLSIV